MDYIRNTWYVAAWDHEVAPGQLLARTLLDERLVLFRAANGRPQALADRCPHRFVPLSCGKQHGDAIRCAYHGLEFDGTGRCTLNPHGDGVIPEAARVRAYPMAERWSVLWIWMGDPARADASLIADFGKSMDPGTRFIGKDYLLARANYQLEIDNILDLSHIEFVHGSTLGSDAVKHAETEVVQTGPSTLFSNRLTRSEIVTASLAQTYGLPKDQPVDRWLDVRFEAPALMELWSGWAPAGTPEPRKVGKRIPFIHLFTPETATTTHYWFATSYPRRMGAEGERRAAHDIAYLRQPFEREDLPILETQQSALGTADFWSLRPVLLPSDAAAVRARRVIDELLRTEREDPKSHATPPAGATALARREPSLRVRVAGKFDVGGGAWCLQLEAADGTELPPFEAGAHIDLLLPNGLKRQYSLCNAPGERHRYQIGVLRDPASRGGSACVHDDVHEGMALTIGQPRNRFALVRGARRSVLLAGGIGITPLLAMAEALHTNGRAFELHHFVRTRQRTAFQRRLQASSFAAAYHLHPDDEQPVGATDWTALLGRSAEGTHLYACGPAGFVQAARGQAQALGWPGPQWHEELFSAPSAEAGETPFEVVAARTGCSVVVRPGQTIVSALATIGVNVPTSCEQGLCGTCLTRVVEGIPEHRDSFLLPSEQARDDSILPCCSRARSERLVLDL